MRVQRRERPERREQFNALVIDQKTRLFGLEYVVEPPENAERYRLGNKGRATVFVLVRLRDGTLEHIRLPERMGGLPERLYRALDWREVNDLFSLTNELWAKLNAFAGIGLVFVLFIAVVALAG